MKTLSFLKNLEIEDIEDITGTTVKLKDGSILKVKVSSPDIERELEHLTARFNVNRPVWIARYSNPENRKEEIQPCATEEAAYEWLAQRGMAILADDTVPDTWVAEDLVHNWSEFGEGSMTVEGPFEVFRMVYPR